MTVQVSGLVFTIGRLFTVPAAIGKSMKPMLLWAAVVLALPITLLAALLGDAMQDRYAPGTRRAINGLRDSGRGAAL